MDLPFERVAGTLENDTLSPEKQATLAWLFPEALRDEIRDVAEAGYDITVGETYDQAYDSPEDIKRIFDRLDGEGKAFARESRQRVLGGASVLTAIEYDLRVSGAIKGARLGGVRRRIKKNREVLRGKHLYDKQEVQAQPWHQQMARRWL